MKNEMVKVVPFRFEKTLPHKLLTSTLPLTKMRC